MTDMFTRLLNLRDLPPSQSLFLLGPRTTGKSTLIQTYLANCSLSALRYDLLKSDDFLRLQSAPSVLRSEITARLSSQHSSVIEPLQVVIDEIQKIPLLLDEVHWLIENFSQKLRFILSGSSARKLKRGGANLLAGRAWMRHLYPLTPLEVGDNFQLNDSLQYGGLPPVVTAASRESKIEFLQSYVSNYLREEIQAEATVRKLASFHRFLEAAAHCNGQMVNMTTIGQEAAVKRPTVASYYQILEDTLLGFFLPVWGRGRSRKDLVAHGKFYFFDTGVVSTLNRTLSGELSPHNPAYGHAFEHFIILNFMRICDYRRSEHTIGFFRTRAGSEVDLVQDLGTTLRAIEIKSGSTIARSDVRGLTSFSDEFPDAELIVVCTAPHPFMLGKIRCVPWREFLAEEKSGKSVGVPKEGAL